MARLDSLSQLLPNTPTERGNKLCDCSLPIPDLKPRGRGSPNHSWRIRRVREKKSWKRCSRPCLKHRTTQAADTLAGQRKFTLTSFWLLKNKNISYIMWKKRLLDVNSSCAFPLSSTISTCVTAMALSLEGWGMTIVRDCSPPISRP